MLRSILQNSTAGFYIFASDSSAPTSGKTGLTITTTLSKAGGTANSVAPTITEIGNGLYWVAPSASHRDTLGEIAWQFSGTGAIIAPRLEKVVAVNDQTARFGAAAAGDLMGLADGAITAAKFAANAIAAAAIASGAFNDKGNWSKAGDQMDLVNSPNATARSAFATTIEAAILNEGDATALLAAIAAKVETFLINDGDAVATLTAIATAVNSVIVAGQIGTDLTATKSSAAAAKVAAESADGKLTAPRLAKIDGAAQTGADGDTLETLSDQIDGVSGGPGGGTDWTSDERTAIRNALGIPTSGTTLLDPSTGILDTIRDQIVANGAALAGAPVQPTGRIASGGALTAYIGDDFRVRSGTELEIPVADVGGALYTKLNAIGAANLYFGASRSGKDAGAITGTVASLAQSGSGASQLLILTVEITNCGNGLQPADDYEYQIEQRQTQGSETDSFVEISGTLELKRKVV